MDVIIEEGEPNGNGSCSRTPEELPPENHNDAITRYIPRLGTVIPSRIFVAGFDHRVGESCLRRVFAQYGEIKEVNIVVDRAGTSKGYGFVTFETEDEARKVLNDASEIRLRDKRLSVAQAFRRHQTLELTKSSVVPLPMSFGTLYQTAPTGCPYTYQNGVGCLHCHTMSHLPHHWHPAPPVMHPQAHQPVCLQPPCHLYPCVPSQYRLNVSQSLVPSGPVVCSQPSELLYQSANEGSVLESTTQEILPLHRQRAEGVRPIALQHDHAKNQTLPHLRVHLQPKYRRQINNRECHCVPIATEPPDSSSRDTSQTPM